MMIAEVADRVHVAGLLAKQSAACGILGSALYAHILAAAADDARAGGPVWLVFRDADLDAIGEAQALRLMAAVHRMVLTGEAPGLEPYYPSVGGMLDLQAAWLEFRRLCGQQPERVRELLLRPCQTNEVGRSAALLGGFLELSARWGLPLRLLEIGSSAGLQLRFDRFFYATGSHAWGDPRSPVRLQDMWIEPPEHLQAKVEVAARRGCDPRPVDPLTPEGRTTLTASVWADQVDRIQRLQGAVRLAEQVPAQVDKASAGDWLPDLLAQPAEGTCTVVFHSVVLQYIAPDERDAVVDCIMEAAAAAHARAPIAWLRLEPEDLEKLDRGVPFGVWLGSWPGPGDRRVAWSAAHGDRVRWTGR